MMSSVASIWPRSEASWIAAVTTFDGQRQIGRLELEALIIGQRRGGLDLPPLAAEHIGRVGDVHSGLVEIENVTAGRLSRIPPARIAGARPTRWRRRTAKACRPGRKGSPWPATARLAPPEGSDWLAALRRSGASISLEWKTFHHSPGISRPMSNFCAAPPATSAEAVVAGCVFRRIAADRRRRRRLKVRSDRAGRQQRQERQRNAAASAEQAETRQKPGRRTTPAGDAATLTAPTAYALDSPLTGAD